MQVEYGALITGKNRVMVRDLDMVKVRAMERVRLRGRGSASVLTRCSDVQDINQYRWGTERRLPVRIGLWFGF